MGCGSAAARIGCRRARPANGNLIQSARRSSGGRSASAGCGDDVEDVPVLGLTQFCGARMIFFLELTELEVAKKLLDFGAGMEAHPAVFDIPAVVRAE